MRRLLVAALLLTALLTACGGGSQDETGAPVRADRLLDFTLPAVGGGEVRGADYGGKALALWFWAPW
jgi:hypothetical protein